ncbi:MAG: Lsr2 family protein [Brachybacterium sp.]|nr:Lsr2 family protein [Brachybacterium sp.]
MARKTFVELIDDIDGSKAEETVSFSLDGVSYEIDLTTDNAQKLRNDVGQWTDKARRVAGRRQRGAVARGEDTGKIRQWARDNGYDVSDRGRISGEIREAYRQAH